jgi:predicted DNA-binding protein (MmcQ/YjbR family)
VARARKADPKKTWQRIHDFALELPEAWEDHPWGETVVKVRKKVFVFLGPPDGDEPGLSVKLTDSHHHALSEPGAVPTGYGLGKAGWVTMPIGGLEPDLLEEWIEESYRNVAPKTLSRQLDS